MMMEQDLRTRLNLAFCNGTSLGGASSMEANGGALSRCKGPMLFTDRFNRDAPSTCSLDVELDSVVWRCSVGSF